MQVKAKERMYYAGRDREIGEVFSTEQDEHARLLVLNGKAEIVTQEERAKRSGRYRRADLRADE